MASNIWSSLASTDGNLAANWSLLHTPQADDDLVFNGTSVINCTLTALYSVNSITITTAYTGTFSDGGFDITTSGIQSFDPTGPLSLVGGKHTVSGDADFHIGSTVTTLTLTNCDLDLKGTGNLDIDKATSISVCFRNITCSYTGKTTTNTSAVTLYYTGTLTLASGGTYTLSAMVWCGSGVATPVIQNGAVVKSLAGGSAGYRHFYIQPQGASTISLALITTVSSVGCYMNDYPGVLVTYNLIGDLKTQAIHWESVNNSNGTLVFNSNNYTIGDSGLDYATQVIQTAGVNISNFTINFGSSAVNIGYYFNTAKDAGAYCAINMGTSVWTLDYGFYLNGVSSFDCGTSQLVWSGGHAGNFTPNAFTMYIVTVNKTGAGKVTLGSTLFCNTLTVTDGEIIALFPITTVGSMLFNAPHNITLGAACLVTGNGDFHISSTATTVTLTGCIVEMRGTGNFDIDKTGLTFASVKFNAPGLTISSTGSADWAAGRWYVEPGTSVIMAAGRSVTPTSVGAGDVDGSLGNLVVFTSSTPGTYWNYVNPAGMTANYVNVTDSNASNSILTSHCVNGGHNVNWNFIKAMVPAGIF